MNAYTLFTTNEASKKELATIGEWILERTKHEPRLESSKLTDLQRYKIGKLLVILAEENRPDFFKEMKESAVSNWCGKGGYIIRIYIGGNDAESDRNEYGIKTKKIPNRIADDIYLIETPEEVEETAYETVAEMIGEMTKKMPVSILSKRMLNSDYEFTATSDLVQHDDC